MENTEATLKYLADKITREIKAKELKGGKENGIERVYQNGIATGLLIAKTMILEYKKQGKPTEDANIQLQSKDNNR